jgi:hypothetical protein
MPPPRLTILLALMAAAFVVLPQSALADRWLPSKRISQQGGASSPLVAMGPQGNATIVFLRDGQLRAVGRAPRKGFKSLGALSPSASAPDLSSGRPGAVGATWIEQGSTIRSALRTGSHAFGDPRTVATQSGGPHAPQIDLDGSGDPTVAWTVDQSGTNQPRVVRIATGGANGGYETPDDVASDNFLGNLRLKVDDAGKATLVWQSLPCIGPNCPNWEVRAANRAAGGTASMPQLVDTSAGDSFEPRAALGIDGEGNATAVWRAACSVTLPCAGNTSGAYIRSATRDSSSPVFGPGTTLSGDVGAIDGPIALAVGPAGEAFAGWGPDAGLGGRPTASRGRPQHSFSSPESLDSSQGDGLALATGGGGGALAAWRRASDGRIYARAGSALTGWAPQPHLLSATGAEAPELAQDAFGNGVAVFERGGEIRAALYDGQPPIIDSIHVPKHAITGRKIAFSADVHDTFTAVTGHWDFGTTATDTGLEVRHGYRTARSYPVTFTARDAGGNTSSVTRTIDVRRASDHKRPKIKLRIKRSVHHKRILLGLHVRVVCSEGCLATATMTHGYRIARARDSRDRRGTVHLFLKPRGKARRRFRANPPSTAVIRATAIDYAGNRSKPRSKRVHIR